jgi:tetratricopeptide (TPR) repeat protein
MENKKKQLCSCGSGRRLRACCDEVKRRTEPQGPGRNKLAMRKAAEELAQQGKHLEACEILERLAALSPHNPLIWNDLGVQYEAAGEIDKALTALRRGRAADPSYPPTLYNLGKFMLDRCMHLQRAGSPAPAMLAEAVDLLNANLDRDPDNADAHHCLALAHGLNQNEPMARAHMTAATRLRAASTVPPGWQIAASSKPSLLG